jgi:negative regulator of flagellin synthesis FlgM
MTDVIRNINSNSQVSGSNSKNNTQATKDDASTPAANVASSQVSARDQVELTGVAQQIDQIAANLAAEPAVDRQKVDEIKAALTEGRFEINNALIAERLIEIDDLLK